MGKKPEIAPLWLFTAATGLLSGGWLLAPFPILIFLGIAPFFALADRIDPLAPAWEKMEWILLANALSGWAARGFTSGSLVPAIIFGILFTLPFMSQAWVSRRLGSATGKIPLLLFWLSLEYIFLKIKPESGSYLADSLQQVPGWTQWSGSTGYLGATAWILLVNFFVYRTFLSPNGFHSLWLIACVISFAGPLVVSYTYGGSPTLRSEMMSMYGGSTNLNDVVYLARGEWVVRTAAWISTLILLYAFVKGETRKR